jgi:di/tricarboxylate transporter
LTLPPLPEAHALAVLVLTAVALALFTRDRIPLETSSVIVLVCLTVGFELFPYGEGDRALHAVDLFHGFGHEALVAVCALMVVGQGLVRTGALEPVGRSLARLWAVSPATSLLLTLVAGGLLSAFVNNTPIVVLLLPILTSVSLRTGAPPSRVLMPMGFATLVGGMGTTIGTSTNLLVVAVAADLGLPRLGMFDFFAPAMLAASLGIVYLWLLAPRMLPDRSAPLGDASPRVFHARLHVQEGGWADGRTLAEAVKHTDGRLRVAGIRRGQDARLVPLPDVTLRAGDGIQVSDTPANLKDFESALEATLYSGAEPVDEDHPLTAEGQQLAEIVVVQGSPVSGVSLGRVHFVERYQLVVLALHRSGRAMTRPREDLANVTLRTGDVLLVQGAAEHIAALRQDSELLVLDATADLPRTRKAPLALGIMAAVILTAGLGILPIAVSAVAGVALMVLTACLTWRDAAQALSAQVILIVVASLALGQALLATGGSEYLTALFLAVTAGASPAVTLSGLMLLMAVLTNIVSNNAAAVIGTPVAVGIAQGLGAPPEPFLLAVLFGANMSYATPMAYKTNLLVMTAGGYRFSDFLRVGIPLTLIIWLSLSLILPRLYGL